MADLQDMPLAMHRVNQLQIERIVQLLANTNQLFKRENTKRANL